MSIQNNQDKAPLAIDWNHHDFQEYAQACIHVISTFMINGSAQGQVDTNDIGYTLSRSLEILVSPCMVDWCASDFETHANKSLDVILGLIAESKAQAQVDVNDIAYVLSGCLELSKAARQHNH